VRRAGVELLDVGEVDHVAVVARELAGSLVSPPGRVLSGAKLCGLRPSLCQWFWSCSSGGLSCGHSSGSRGAGGVV
jgi:hypothetical protein